MILNVVSAALVSKVSCWHVPSVATDPPAATVAHDAASSSVVAAASAPSILAMRSASESLTGAVTSITTIFMAGSA